MSYVGILHFLYRYCHYLYDFGSLQDKVFAVLVNNIAARFLEIESKYSVNICISYYHFQRKYKNTECEFKSYDLELRFLPYNIHWVVHTICSERKAVFARKVIMTLQDNTPKRLHRTADFS